MERCDVLNSLKTFKSANRNLQWNKKYLMCDNCEQWLISSIFSDERGFNYCVPCKPTMALRCYTLEDMLRSTELMYPCQIVRCKFVGNALDLANHLRDDPHGSFNCPNCDAQTSDYLVVRHYEANHPEYIRNLFTTDLIVVIPYDRVPFESCLFNVRVSRGNVHHQFIVLLYVQDKYVSFKVGSHSVDLLGAAKYIAVASSRNCTTACRGTIHKVWPIFANKEIEHVQMSRMCGMNITLYFGGKYDLTNMERCVFCTNELQWKVYQCGNGHGVCSSCRQNSTCPSCRASIMGRETTLELLFPKNNYYCPFCCNEENCISDIENFRFSYLSYLDGDTCLNTELI